MISTNAFFTYVRNNIYIMEKICKTCNISKDLSFFNKDKSIIGGYRNTCKDCRKIYLNKNKDKIQGYYKTYSKNYYSKNKDIINEVCKEYYINNKEHIKSKNKEYYKNNINKNKQYQNIYRAENKDKIAAYKKDKYNSDPLYRLKSNIRNLTYQAFKNNGYIKNSKTENMLGCSYEFLLKYIENLFEDWMTFENKGLYEKDKYKVGWDIDHIIPLSNANNVEELIKLFHYTNLQPLCSKINRDIKKAKA